MAKHGPKPRGEFASKGATLSARITVGTRQRLVEEARKNDQSLSAELEVRLERSFVDQADLRDFGSDKSYALLRLAADAIRDAEWFVGKRWYEDPYAFLVAVEEVRSSFEALHPKGNLVAPDTFPNLPHLEGFPPDIRQGVRDHLVKQGPKMVARSLARGMIARLQAATTSEAGENPLRHLALALLPLITDPVLPLPPEPDQWDEDAIQARLRSEREKESSK